MTLDPSPTLFILNKRAGHGAAGRRFGRIRPLLTPNDAVAVTSRHTGAAALAAEAANSGYETIVAAGGDGTVNQVISGLAGSGFRPTLGILPIGGANDFAHTLGLPRTPCEALAVIRTGRRRQIDVGEIRLFHSGSTLYFANALGMGVSGEVAVAAAGDKRWGSAVAYLAPLAARLFTQHPRRVLVRTGETVITRRLLVGTVANGRREGRLFVTAPMARIDDGLLDLLTVEDVRPPLRPVFVLHSILGRFRRARGVHRQRITSATVEAIDPLPCHADGEPFGLQPGDRMTVTVLPAHLTILAP